ncbi:MAG TPA: DUF885 domain-containing protein [Acidimicrobiia bacterium]|jgi:uncharacterized protein (DUF885 family)|nr:DUF885 domain-containing protein [Acidimicrobiia bacterium]
MTFDQSHPIFALSDTLVDELCELFPDEATYLGVDGFDDRWPDLSPAGAETAVARLRSMQLRVDEVPPPTNRWEGLAIEVARDEMERQLDWFARGAHLRDLNSISSPVQGLRETFDHMKRDSAQAWDNIVERLDLLQDVIDGYVASLEHGRHAGMAVPIRQVEEAARQADVSASGESYFLTLIDDFDGAGIDDASLRRQLVAGVEGARAAYGGLATYLRESYAQDAPNEDAVGPDRYRWRAQRVLGTDLDLHETYAWGWTEVASLRKRMNEVAQEIVPGGGIEDALEILKTDPARAAATPGELVAFLDARIEEALERLSGTHFDVPDSIRTCDVKLAPPGGSLGAYYVGPSEDFARPGSVWWSIDRSKPVALYDEVTTAYHEGFPGHHLQVGVQVSLRDRLSRIHRLWTWMPGSGEGWALYAERLMDELGYLDKPDYVFGFLSAQMLRACRVVIDIGSHLRLPIPDDQQFRPGEEWTYETAVEMLERYATQDRANAESEVNRYLGWPGQAIAYKVGERTILDLRREMKVRLGPEFDEKAFHQRLLEVGPLGLDLVRRFALSSAE